MTAVVLAGSRPGGDPLAASLGVDLKALIPLAGKPMLRWPVEALLASDQIAFVRVLSQQPERVGAALPADPRLTVERSGETIAATLEALCTAPTTSWPLLVTTADHGLLDAAMVADFCTRGAGADLDIGVVEQRSLLARLPESRRTWLRFRGGAYSGANLFLLGSPRALAAIALWRGVEQDRKKGWRLLLRLGPSLLLGAALRLLTIDQAAQRVGRRLGLEVRAVVLADPLAGVDVDKAEDMALVETILEARR